MDFVVGLPNSPWNCNAIWVIMDHLNKSAHFLLVKFTYSLQKYATFYIVEIVRLHSIPVLIMLDRDSRLVSKFWKSLQRALGTKLNFSTTFIHRRMDNQREPSRLQKICYDYTCLIFKGIRKHTYHFWSSPTTTVFMQASGWHLMKHSMGENVDLPFVGPKLENGKFWGRDRSTDHR